MTRLFGEGNETRWRDPGVSICLRCPVDSPHDAVCQQADNRYSYNAVTVGAIQCPWAIARSVLGGSIRQLTIAEEIAETTLHPDRPASVAEFTAALTEAAAQHYQQLQEAV
jgi:hypothetical protein